MNIIDEFKHLTKLRSERDYIIALIGFNAGLRVGDIISLRVGDVYKKKHIRIREQKTGKSKMFPIGHIVQEINNYIESHGLLPGDPLFPSRKKGPNGELANITTVQAYRKLKSVAEQLGIDYFGTHSLRKSFGYHFYKKTQDIASLMKIFNHSSQAVTMIYIGITQENIDERMSDFYL